MPNPEADRDRSARSGRRRPAPLSVADVMHHGVIGCRPSATLIEAADALARHHVHALLVEGDEGAGQLRVLSDTDLIEALGQGVDPAETRVEAVAATEPVTVSSSEPVEGAARTMSDHQVTHLIVLDQRSGEPAGVISSLDIAQATRRAHAAEGELLSMVVAHDGRPGGDDAAALARALAGDDAEVLATIVMPYPPKMVGDPPLHVKPRAGSWKELIDDLEGQGVARLDLRARPLLGGLRYEPRVILDDSAARGLTEVCEQTHPDLLVVGSTHRGRIGSLLPGATVDRLLNGSPSPVAVAPAGYAGRAPEPIRSIGVGFDGSVTAARALALAAGLAARHGAELKVIAIVEAAGESHAAGSSPDAPPEQGSADRQAEWLRTAAETQLQKLTLHVSTSVEIAHGDPAEVLLGSCRQDVDLIVLGSRGYGPLGRVLLGSVSHDVVHHADCPVLVAPRARAH